MLLSHYNNESSIIFQHSFLTKQYSSALVHKFNSFHNSWEYGNMAMVKFITNASLKQKQILLNAFICNQIVSEQKHSWTELLLYYIYSWLLNALETSVTLPDHKIFILLFPSKALEGSMKIQIKIHRRSYDWLISKSEDIQPDSWQRTYSTKADIYIYIYVIL